VRSKCQAEYLKGLWTFPDTAPQSAFRHYRWEKMDRLEGLAGKAVGLGGAYEGP
jgi:hypothetical protein